MEPFARISGRSEDFEDTAQRAAIVSAVGRRQRSTRVANLGTFTGYRIGLDIGNGNIGWCILFEERLRPEHPPRLYFLTAEGIRAHNAELPKSATRTQLPILDDFVPLGTHKFEARERAQKGEKSFHKIRAESKSKSRLLDARQRRRLHVKKALQEAGLYPRDNEPMEAHVEIKADVLRIKLLDPSFRARPHDLGRALYNALQRRGLMKPVGRAGEDEDSGFAKRADESYRAALTQFSCRTIGEFLERCAKDAKHDGHRFRKRHRSLAEQKADRKNKPKDLAAAKSYEVFAFLTPTFGLIREECRLLRDAQRANVSFAEEAWSAIEEAAEFRRPLKAKVPGWCEYFCKPHYRCIRALPSFQRFRIREQVSHLRDANGKVLNRETFNAAVNLLERNERMSLGALSKELGTKLKRDKDDETGSRSLVGAKSDMALTEAFGATWSELPIERRDDWTMRFLRRHWPPVAGDELPPWTETDEDALQREAAATFGPGALAKVDDEVAKHFEDKFSSMSVKAARLRADCYAERLSHKEMNRRMREAGAPEPVLPLYERLPYYGAVMPDLVVPAEGFAPKERIVQEELEYGRAANPDVHVVMNRLRIVVNEIIEMMGGILPARCVIEMARSAFSEDQANAYSKTARAREELRTKIVAEIEKVLGGKMPIGPSLEKLVDRWKAAVRQGWRDYDGNRIQPSALVDGSVYQLDHVMPAAFGDSRENNMFVSRFNQKKGRRLPWDAFKDDPGFRPSLIAFATFGLQQQIKGIKYALSSKQKIPKKRKERLEKTLEHASQTLDKLAKEEGPRPDVLKALERTLTGGVDSLVAGELDSDDQSRPKEKGRPFRPGDQAALFRRFIWESRPEESEPAARDIANIGWNTKLALRYVRHLGAEPEAIKAWVPYALRCMFDINKCRRDLRNHAVDAFLVAHFDRRVLLPGFNRLRHQLPYEALYETRALRWALDQVAGGGDRFEDFTRNLDCLDRVLPYVATAHRADNRWNPGDHTGGSFGAVGGENTYTFRPTTEKRKELTKFLCEGGHALREGHVMTRKEILDFLRFEPADKKTRKLQTKLAEKIELHYWSRNDAKPKKTTLKYPTALELSGQPDAFIDAESKFAIVGAAKKVDRRVVSVAKFSHMSGADRAALFADGCPVYRRGDTVIHDGCAFVITGLQDDTRVIAYPIDEAGRDKGQKNWITAEPSVFRFASDVLGRRLHRVRKDRRDLEPVPYPLRDK